VLEVYDACKSTAIRFIDEVCFDDFRFAPRGANTDDCRLRLPTDDWD
jgi:hypothetical protein